MTVVVDRGALGGGIDQVCNGSGGGKSATTLFTGSGFSLTYVQQTPGFVCRINGQPSSDPCVQTPPSDAYWGLWWSDGTSGSWSYSSIGAGSLTVPDGGYVAFAWQSGSKSAPGVPATAHASPPSSAPTPSPSSSPSAGGTGGGNSGGGGNGGNNGGGGNNNGGGGNNGGANGGGNGGGHTSASPTPSASSAPSSSTSATPSADPSASPTGKGGNGPKNGPSATPAPSSSMAPTPSTEPTTAAASPSTSADGVAEVQTTSEGSALPVWVVPVVILALAAGAGVMLVVRRRGRSSL